MEITSTTPTTLAASAAPAPKADTAIASDFETFLRMLTVQMQNQDPLNPVKAEDFSVQLATFASVEQQVKTNDLLTALQNQMGLSGMSQFAEWIGKEARGPVAAYFDGSPVTVAPQPRAEAESAFLVVRDANGSEVQRLPIPVTDALLSWDGTTAGGALPEGSYRFQVESWKDGSLDAIDTADVYTPIVETRLQDGETVLVTRSGAEISATQITALRDPAQG